MSEHNVLKQEEYNSLQTELATLQDMEKVYIGELARKVRDLGDSFYMHSLSKLVLQIMVLIDVQVTAQIKEVQAETRDILEKYLSGVMDSDCIQGG